MLLTKNFIQFAQCLPSNKKIISFPTLRLDTTGETIRSAESAGFSVHNSYNSIGKKRGFELMETKNPFCSSDESDYDSEDNGLNVNNSYMMSIKVNQDKSIERLTLPVTNRFFIKFKKSGMTNQLKNYIEYRLDPITNKPVIIKDRLSLNKSLDVKNIASRLVLNAWAEEKQYNIYTTFEIPVLKTTWDDAQLGILTQFEVATIDPTINKINSDFLKSIIKKIANIWTLGYILFPDLKKDNIGLFEDQYTIFDWHCPHQKLSHPESFASFIYEIISSPFFSLTPEDINESLIMLINALSPNNMDKLLESIEAINNQYNLKIDVYGEDQPKVYQLCQHVRDEGKVSNLKSELMHFIVPT